MARVALDIDSTLHHYWDVLERVVHERHGVRLRYEDQTDWGITQLDRDLMIAAVHETHSDDNVAAAVPYPDAVETVRGWHAAGHWIHVTSHRRTESAAATERWLDAIGMPFDDLHCSFDKVPRCVELDIDVLVDDSPQNIVRARDAGIVAATLAHPWNRHLLEQPGVVWAEDWQALAASLEPVLAQVDARDPG